MVRILGQRRRRRRRPVRAECRGRRWCGGVGPHGLFDPAGRRSCQRAEARRGLPGDQRRRVGARLRDDRRRDVDRSFWRPHGRYPGSQDARIVSMGKVLTHMAMSLDGFIANPTDEPGELFDWYWGGDVTVASANDEMTFNVDAASAEMLRDLI